MKVRAFNLSGIAAMVDRELFSRRVEGLPVTVRRLTTLELLGIDESFKRFACPVGIFVNSAIPKLVAVVEFDDLFDLNGNRFDND